MAEKQLNTRVSPRVHQKLERIAKDTERSKHWHQVKAIEQYLAGFSEAAPQKQTMPAVTKKDRPPSKRFIEPSANEVINYMMARKLGEKQASTEGHKFVDFYACKGWMVGKNKMKCWKAATRNWLKNVTVDTNADIFTDESWLNPAGNNENGEFGFFETGSNSPRLAGVTTGSQSGDASTVHERVQAPTVSGNDREGGVDWGNDTEGFEFIPAD
jgi:hypothetical protein